MLHGKEFDFLSAAQHFKKNLIKLALKVSFSYKYLRVKEKFVFKKNKCGFTFGYIQKLYAF